MSKRKSEEERFGEQVAKIGVAAAQKQLDILKGFMGSITKDSEQQPKKPKPAKALAAAGSDKVQ